jgi:hypothetical protein
VLLIARADVLREEIGAGFESWAVTMNDETFSISRTELGEHRFAMAWDDGRTLTVDQAVDIALGPWTDRSKSMRCSSAIDTGDPAAAVRDRSPRAPSPVCA